MSTFQCLACGAENPNKKNHANKYCSNKCQGNHKTQQLDALVDAGKASNTGQVKRYLLRKHGNVCSVCSITEWHGKPITMEMDHLNGDAGDNRLENCCLLCPNCHSQTATFKGRNMGNGRAKRKQRYQDGKSY